MSNFKTDNTTVKAFGEANKRIKESFLSLGVSLVHYTVYVHSVNISHTAYLGKRRGEEAI